MEGLPPNSNPCTRIRPSLHSFWGIRVHKGQGKFPVEKLKLSWVLWGQEGYIQLHKVIHGNCLSLYETPLW